ncbi:uncharacterized protein PAC_17683 [Phialocephala subalpina]|uniref:Uncharacterized protein n=1 Tax=Phialocephala subalpina TaxID=576137 RepID=A0A1L7XRW8_9HELO|nr:uncharacterized protein PAC_17683 [Phialocephala subalpina]
MYHPSLKMLSLVEIKQYLGGQVFGKPFVLDLTQPFEQSIRHHGSQHWPRPRVCQAPSGPQCWKDHPRLSEIRERRSSKEIYPEVPSTNLYRSLASRSQQLRIRTRFWGSSEELTTPGWFHRHAGIDTVAFKLSEGFEHSLTVNVISTTLLSILALLKLKQTAESTRAHTNLVIVGSMQHAFAPSPQLKVPEGRNIFEVLSDQKTADMQKRYEFTELTVQQVEKELAERLSKGGQNQVVVNCVNPGWCATELSRYYDKGRIVGLIFSLIGRTTEAGEQDIGPCCDGRGGDSRTVLEEGDAVQKRLWKDVSEDIERLSPGALAAVG